MPSLYCSTTSASTSHLYCRRFFLVERARRRRFFLIEIARHRHFFVERAAMDHSSEEMIVGLEEVIAGSKEVSDEVVPFSVNVVADSVESVAALDSEEAALDIAVLDTVDPLDIAALDTVEALDSVEIVPDSMEIVPDSVEEVPDVDVVVHCPRCGTFHAGGVFGEECRQARREARRCARCGLLHEDYDNLVKVLWKMEKFDCEVFIPDLDELIMKGDSIFIHDHVRKKLDEHYNAMMKLEEEEANMKKQ